MAYEILALDLDGTLTNSEKQITAATREAIIDIMKKGKKVVLASGRPTTGIRRLVEELQMKEHEGYVLSYNGAYITNCHTGQVIDSKPLSPEVIAEVYDIAETYDVDFITYDSENLFCNREPNKYTEYEQHTEGMPIVVLEDFVKDVDFPIHKCVFVGDPKIIVEIEKELKKRYPWQYSIYRSEPFFVEIMSQNTDKATALQTLLDSLKLTQKQLICCGDGYNDLPMIEFAGLGVAMENAQPEVKDKADFITKSNDEDGVLHVIEKYMRR